MHTLGSVCLRLPPNVPTATGQIGSCTSTLMDSRDNVSDHWNPAWCGSYAMSQCSASLLAMVVPMAGVSWANLMANLAAIGSDGPRQARPQFGWPTIRSEITYQQHYGAFNISKNFVIFYNFFSYFIVLNNYNYNYKISQLLH